MAEEKGPISYSVVVPVFNSDRTLVDLYERIQEVFSRIIHGNFEVIFVDDGSENERTWQTLERLREISENVIIIQLTRNFGQHAATLCGIEHARGDYVITMDDDLEHLPEEIPVLLSQNHHDIVMARFEKRNHSPFKRYTSKIKTCFAQMTLGIPKAIEPTPFRLMKSEIAKKFLSINTSYPFIPAMMFQITKDVVTVPVEHGKRNRGRSGYGISKMINIFSNLLLNNSAFLLRSIGLMGIGISIVAFFFGVYFIIRKLMMKTGVVGWTSLIVTILFLGGIILFSLGVIGEYLIRIIRTAERKPAYVVRHKR